MEQYGQINLRVKGLAKEANRFHDEMAFTLLRQGDSTSGSGILDGKDISCYDGEAFFATSHSEGESGTQSNKGTSELGSDSLKTALTAMRKLKDDQGNIVTVRPNLLIVPPDLEWTARELLNSTYYPEEGSTTAKLAKNVLNGVLELLVSPYLTDTNDWFVLDTTGYIKPIIFQVRREPEFNEIKSTSEYYLRGKVIYTVDWRGMTGFGDWRYAYGSFPS